MSVDHLSPVPVTWQPRELPLVACAAAALGKTAINLAGRLLDSGGDALASLKGIAGRGVLIVAGAAESLPWVNGVVYLGRDPRASSLLVPTTLEPSVPLPLLERALAARFPGMLPLAVLPNANLAVPMGVARPVDANSLRLWLEHNRV